MWTTSRQFEGFILHFLRAPACLRQGGTNTVLGSRYKNMSHALDLFLGIEGEAVVFRTGDDGSFELIARGQSDE